MPRTWTQEESQYLRTAYGVEDVHAIASRLGRSTGAVYQHAAMIGIAGTIDRNEVSKRDKMIQRLHAKGWSASEMQPKVGIGSRTINERINRMGLKPHGRSDRYRKRVAAKTKEQCQKAGVKNLADVRAKRFDEFVSSLGWPGLSVRAAQIAEALYRLGPMTRKQICQAIEIPWRGSRKSLSTNRVPGGSYMAELQQAGIVVRLESAITRKGKGNHEDLYMIGLDVEPCRKAK